MMAGSTSALQSEAGYIDARPQIRQIDENLLRRTAGPYNRVKNASGLYNLMRNLGGAVGLAAIYTFLNDRTDLHLARLHEALNSAYRPALEALDGLTSRFQAYGSDARIMALKQLFMMTHREGLVMALGDVFLALTVLFAVMSLSTMVMKRPSVGAAPASEH